MAEHLLAKIWTGVYQDPEKTFPARNDLDQNRRTQPFVFRIRRTTRTAVTTDQGDSRGRSCTQKSNSENHWTAIQKQTAAVLFRIAALPSANVRNIKHFWGIVSYRCVVVF